MKHTIRIWWIVAGTYALIMASALGLLYLSFRQQMDRLEATTEGSALSSMDSVVQWIGDSVQRGEWQPVQDWLSKYTLPGYDFNFQVVLPDGSIVVDSHPSSPPAKTSYPEVQQALSGSRPVSTRLAPQVYLVTVPILGSGGAPIAALVGQVDWTARFQQSQSDLLGRAALGFGFILLVLLVSVLLLWKLIVAPISRLRVMADMVARDGTAPRLPGFLARELDQTGQAINKMLDRLGEHRREMDLLNRQLEETVARRTRQLETRNRELLTLNRISTIAMEARSLPQAYQQIVEEISSATGFPTVLIERYDPAQRVLSLQAGVGLNPPADQPPLETSAERSLAGLVVASAKPLVGRDIMTSPEFAGRMPRRYPARAFLCVPMESRQGVMGAITLASPDSLEVDEALVNWVSALSNHMMALYERLHAAAALAESEERFKMALDGTGLGVWDWDISSGKIVINPLWSSMLGYEASDIRADVNMWPRLVHPEDYPRLRTAMDEHLSGKSPSCSLELRMRTRDGHWKWVVERARVVSRDEQSRPLRMVGTQRDIDEQKAAEEELRRRDTILEAVNFAAERFLSSASWEESLPVVLARLGEANRAARVSVFEAIQDIDGAWLSRQHSEWTAPGIPPEMERDGPQVLSLRAGGFGRWEEELSQGHAVCGRVSTFPAGEQASLGRMGVRSLAVMPIFVSGRWWGYIGLDDCLVGHDWSLVELDALKVAAGILGAAIQRQQIEEMVKRLYETEREQNKLAQVLRHTGATFSASLSYDNILDRILDELPHLMPFDAAHVMLVMDQEAVVARQRGYEDFDPRILPKLSVLSFDIQAVPALRWMVEKQLPLVASDTRVAPGLVRLVEKDVFRSWAAAPIVIQGRVTAFFVIEKTEAYFYRTEQAEVLALFANQVGSALQNAQLFAEALGALEREQNLNEVTRAISSAIELPTILQNVVRLAVELCGADAGALAILSPDGSSLAYPYLFNLPVTLGAEAEPRGVGLAWETIQSARSQVLVEYRQYPHATPSWVEAGVHGAIAVPLIAGDVCLGGLGLFSYHVEKRFTQRDLALMESVGRQAGIAIQNARLFEAAERRARESETLRQAVAEVTTALELDQVLDKILYHLKKVVPYDSSAVFLYEGTHMLRLMAGRGLPNFSEVINHVYPADNDLFLEIKRSSPRPVILRDAQQDPRFERWGKADYTHGWMGLPLCVRGEPIGYLTMDSREVGAYSEQDAVMVQAFADEVAIAIENANLFKQVQHLAITDPLTGLNNRRYFFEAARHELERARRYQSSLSLIMLDIDHFKRVNDTYGHQVGDRVLVGVTNRCREKLREVDICARYGGEEFVFLLPETDLERARQVAERLCSVVNDTPVEAGEKQISISISLGVAELDEDCLDIQALVRRADMAQYVSKARGRRQVTTWTPEMGATDA
jgi:diguanylate cyclase (GGDEF)-like protein/PAS domain S-box-containing protein